jgi:5'(3')-deoxyribonucleotidase
MDGVIADFHKMAVTVLGKEPDSITNDRWPDSDWEHLREYPGFFRKIPKMAQADRMIDQARRFRDELGWQLYILTAVPHLNDMPDAFQDKMDWVNEHYPDLRVRFGPYSRDKQDHCRPGDVLVDDRGSNCVEWRSRGGITVQVTGDYQSALVQLENLFREAAGILAKREAQKNAEDTSA